MFLDYFVVTLSLGAMVVVALAAVIMRDNHRLARFTVKLGIWGMIVFGVLFSTFAAGYAFEDLPFGEAMMTVAIWVVPVLVFALLIWRVPATGPYIGFGLSLLALIPVVFEAFWPKTWREFQDNVGPVAAISIMSVGVVLAFWAMREPKLAGFLMVGLGLVFVICGLFTDTFHGGTSSEVANAPVLVAGILIAAGASLKPERVG